MVIEIIQKGKNTLVFDNISNKILTIPEPSGMYRYVRTTEMPNLVKTILLQWLLANQTIIDLLFVAVKWFNKLFILLLYTFMWSFKPGFLLYQIYFDTVVQNMYICPQFPF